MILEITIERNSQTSVRKFRHVTSTSKHKMWNFNLFNLTTIHNNLSKWQPQSVWLFLEIISFQDCNSLKRRKYFSMQRDYHYDFNDQETNYKANKFLFVCCPTEQPNDYNPFDEKRTTLGHPDANVLCWSSDYFETLWLQTEQLVPFIIVFDYRLFDVKWCEFNGCLAVTSDGGVSSF